MESRSRRFKWSRWIDTIGCCENDKRISLTEGETGTFARNIYNAEDWHTS